VSGPKIVRQGYVHTEAATRRRPTGCEGWATYLLRKGSGFDTTSVNEPRPYGHFDKSYVKRLDVQFLST